jgi:hypothetical protein
VSPVSASIGIQASRSRASWTISSQIWFLRGGGEGQVAQAGVAGVSDVVLAAGPAAVTQFQVGELAALGVGRAADTSGAQLVEQNGSWFEHVDSIMGMPDVWIGFTDAARRRNWWWTGVLTLIHAGAAVAMGFSAPAPNRWGWVIGVGVTWVAVLFYMINHGYGRTLLTASGMEFRTFVSRRSIPWSEIAGIEKREHLTRGGSWWDLRAVRVRGRSLAIPGAFATRMWDAEFEQQLVAIHERWSRAVGD